LDGARNVLSPKTALVLVPMFIGALVLLPAVFWSAPTTNPDARQQAAVHDVVASLAGGPGNPGILAPLTGSLHTEPPQAAGLNPVIRADRGHVYVSAAAAQAFRAAAKRQRDAAAAIGQQADAMLSSANQELALSNADDLRRRRQQHHHDLAVAGQAIAGAVLGLVLILPPLRRRFHGT